MRPTQAGLDLVDEAELVKSAVITSALERMTVEELERLSIATADLRIAIEAELAASPERYADLAQCSHAGHARLPAGAGHQSAAHPIPAASPDPGRAGA